MAEIMPDGLRPAGDDPPVGSHPEGVDVGELLGGVEAADLGDEAVAHPHQLAARDVQGPALQAAGGALDRHDVLLTDRDVDELGAQGATGQRPEQDEELVPDGRPPLVDPGDGARAGEHPDGVPGEQALQGVQVAGVERRVGPAHHVHIAHGLLSSRADAGRGREGTHHRIPLIPAATSTPPHATGLRDQQMDEGAPPGTVCGRPVGAACQSVAMEAEPAEMVRGKRFTREDWYARDLGAGEFVECAFVDCDLTEVTSSGATFDRCEFRGVQLNASTHERSRFTGCLFAHTSFFTATFRGCKLTGSEFVDVTLRPITVEGGDWSYVQLRGADLRGLVLAGVNLQEADLSEANLHRASLADSNLGRATLRSANVTEADLAGADLVGVDLAGLSWRGTRIDGLQAQLIAESLGAVVTG